MFYSHTSHIPSHPIPSRIFYRPTSHPSSPVLQPHIPHPIAYVSHPIPYNLQLKKASTSTCSRLDKAHTSPSQPGTHCYCCIAPALSETAKSIHNSGRVAPHPVCLCQPYVCSTAHLASPASTAAAAARALSEMAGMPLCVCGSNMKGPTFPLLVVAVSPPHLQQRVHV